MTIIQNAIEMQSIAKSLHKKGNTIACVPTMGFLHEGHLELIKYASEIADIVITTLFVNPKQFAPNEDFAKYPRDFENDSLKAKSSGSNYLFAPSIDEMYPKDFSTSLHISGITECFEGIFRPEHFDGVAIVVAKLFGCTMPDYAIFGQKDYQQTLLIKRFTQDLNLPIEIIVRPTIREKDGLAKSSRNKYLSEEERSIAPDIYRALLSAKDLINQGIRNREEIENNMLKIISESGKFKVQYLSASIANNLTQPDNFSENDDIVLLAACYLGTTRLIDNIIIKSK